MKVSELIEQLSKLDSDWEVRVPDDDEGAYLDFTVEPGEPAGEPILLMPIIDIE